MPISFVFCLQGVYRRRDLKNINGHRSHAYDIIRMALKNRKFVLAVSKLYDYLTKMMNHAYTPLKYNWIGIFTEFWKVHSIENVQNCKKNNLAKRKILL